MPPRNVADKRIGTAATIIHRLRAFRRGNAMSRAPIINGMMKFPKGPVTMMIVAMIMIRPCRPTIALYCCGLRKLEFGLIRLVRMSMAMAPPTANRTMVSTRYWMPTTLWSVVNRKYRRMPWSFPARNSSSSEVRSRPRSQPIGPLNAPMPAMKPIAQQTMVMTVTWSGPKSFANMKWRAMAHPTSAKTRPPPAAVTTFSRRIKPPPVAGSPSRGSVCRVLTVLPFVAWLSSRRPPFLGSDPRSKFGAAHHMSLGLHVCMQQPTELGAAHVKGAQPVRDDASLRHLTRVGVDLDPHLNDPEGVDDVLARDVEDHRPVHRQIQLLRLDVAVLGVGEGPHPLLAGDVHDHRIGRRGVGREALHLTQPPDQRKHGQTCGDRNPRRRDPSVAPDRRAVADWRLRAP